jgi:hypothetical protein
LEIRIAGEPFARLHHESFFDGYGVGQAAMHRRGSWSSVEVNYAC